MPNTPTHSLPIAGRRQRFAAASPLAAAVPALSALSVLAAALAAPAAVFAAPATAPAAPLVVHEWGTFTTLVTSWGEPLEGLYVDASRLPDFVHGLPFFQYGSSGWPARENLRGVTVKMETPVLYFYSKEEVPVSVKVGFRGGTISQWFPQRHDGEANPAGPVVDLGAGPYQGSISWKAKVLDPDVVGTFTQAREETPETREWRAPRVTGSNLLEGERGEIEKFLFYRGLGNFPLALSLRFDADGKLQVRNGGAEDIPFVLVYQLDLEDGQGGMPYVWWKGGLAAGAGKTLSRPEAPDYSQGMAAMEELHKAMMAEGLYADEARALLNTWYDGYFHESGLKAFWILPRRQVDSLLPLEMSPAPDSLERVIIGRSEILSPEVEAELIAEGGALPSRARDKYHLAYLDFLDRWTARASVPVTHRRPQAAARRPWRMVLPWEGPFGSPALRSGAAGAGKAAMVDVLGKALPAAPVRRGP